MTVGPVGGVYTHFLKWYQKLFGVSNERTIVTIVVLYVTKTALVLSIIVTSVWINKFYELLYKITNTSTAKYTLTVSLLSKKKRNNSKNVHK